MEQNDDRVSLNVFEQISCICKEFRRGWKDGKRPRIEGWLNRVAAPARSTLFTNLIQLEIRIREKLKENPTSAEYHQRFPKFASQVRQAFDESTMGSMESAARSTEDVDADNVTRTFEIPAANHLGDYELLGELGRGGFGVVYKARHLTRNNVVALKTLPTGVDGQEINADRLHKFRREFRSLSEINHPNLVGMQTLEVDGSQWFFTMDLIQGEDFLSFVRPNDERDEKRLRSAIKQLATGIIFLHEKGIVHRDLKPSNVLVDETGRVIILDFGLVAQLQTVTDQTVSRSGMFAGTPRYAAPEQMFGQRSEASDWYALGTMLYEALLGQPPFAGKLMEVLRQKQNEDPRHLVDHIELPTDLARLADALLTRNPKQRPDAAAIVTALSLEVGSSSQGSVDEMDLSIGNSLDGNPVLIGREAQLHQLELAKQELLEQRQPQVVFISGLSGEGKSALAKNFLQPIRLGREMLVLSGRCYDRESVPFKAVDSVIDELVAFLRSRNTDEVLAWLPDNDVDLLRHLFPLLRRVDVIDRLPTTHKTDLDSNRMRTRAFRALRDLLRRISRSIPLVLLIDDLQWGDVESANVLLDLLSPRDPIAVLFLGTFRSDERLDSPFLTEWDEQVAIADTPLQCIEVHVGPLTVAQCVELANQHWVADPDLILDRAEDLVRETGGNPYLLGQVLETIDPTAGIPERIELGKLIDSRLNQLPDDSYSLLSLIAVSGQAIAIEELRMAAGQVSSVFATLTHMCNEKLIRLIGESSDQLVDTYHDKIRETTLDRIEPVDRRALHLTIGETIESLDDDFKRITASAMAELGSNSDLDRVSLRVFDLAYHFFEAQDPRAFEFLVLAGERACLTYALENGLDFLQKAIELLPPDVAPEIKYRIYMRLGWVQLRLKDTQSALSHYETAFQSAPTDLNRAAACTGCASVYQMITNYDEAVKYCDLALTQLGKTRPKKLLGKLFNTQVSTARILTIPSRWQQISEPVRKARIEHEHEVYYLLSQISYDRNMFEYVQVCSRAAVLAEQTGSPKNMGRSYGKFALNYSMMSLFPFAKMFARWAAGQMQQTDDAELRADTLSYLGMVDYMCGDLQRSEQRLLSALESLEQVGKHYMSNMTAHILRHVYTLNGDTAKELEAAKHEMKLAQAAGDVRGICWGHYGTASALAKSGKLSESRNEMDAALEIFHDREHCMTLSGPICLGTDGFVWLQCSEFERARQSLEKSWAGTLRELAFCDWTCHSFALLLESNSGPDWLETADESIKRRLKKLCRAATVVYPLYPNQRSAIDRGRGRAMCALGKKRKAERYFNRSVKRARQHGYKFGLARGLLDLAAVKEQGREENRAEAIRLLKQMESVIPRAESWLLGDQFDESVVAPEFDLAAWELEHGDISTGLAKKV